MASFGCHKVFHLMTTERIKLDVFGRLMVAEHTSVGWQLFELGYDGKRRPVNDAVVPDFISAPELAQYLGDIFHESATDRHPEVRRIAE